MKPMLERKRRARINRCLDELKELMVSALQSEGENVSKLEKADILELTVQHLHKLRREDHPDSRMGDNFRAGFTSCASEVSQYLASQAPESGVDRESGVKLLQHLGSCIRRMETPSSHQPTVVMAADVSRVWRPW
ncbi:hypothetical protein AAG570_002506 [Ranatra chinensis]|uniref:Uncharacterized protein n=1 Tax=Ranatra chinensis TaxID=642074 RepID=A0ABD0Y858_9HEMI